MKYRDPIVEIIVLVFVPILLMGLVSNIIPYPLFEAILIALGGIIVYFLFMLLVFGCWTYGERRFREIKGLEGDE